MKSKIGSLLKVLALTGLLAVVVAVMSVHPLSAQNEPPPMEEDSRMAPVAGKQNGIAYASWWKGQYSDPLADISLENLADTGANWMSLLVTWYQDTLTTTTIVSDTDRTPTDADIQHAVEKAHELGVSVMLKPHVDLNNYAWRGFIGEGFETQADWDAWFASYTDFILYYAQMAQDLGVDQFCVGTELMSTEAQTISWRNVISEVAAVYTGTLTYAANHGSENAITWWDDLDYIGVDAYYRLVENQAHTNPTVDELKATWATLVISLEALSEQYDRPIIFTEVGYRSVDGMTYQPWDYSAGTVLDLQEQVDAYQALFESVYTQTWFNGLYMWSWDTNPAQGGMCDLGYSPYNKPAENVLRQWYGAEQKVLPGGGLQPKPDYDNALSLYSDQMDNGWWNGSWGGTVALTATDEVYEGNYAIRGDFLIYNWGAIALGIDTPVDTTPYRWLEFALLKDVASRELRIFGNTDTGAEVAKISEACFIAEENDDWMLVRVPLSEFYANDRLMSRFAVQNFTNDAGTIWMDNVKLVPAAPTVDFTQAEYRVGEGDGEAVITVTLVSDTVLAGPFTVNYATEAGTALADSDFITSSGTLVFAPGTTEMTFTVTIVDNDVHESAERLALILSDPDGGSATIQLGGQNNPAILNIVDDDEMSIFLPLVLRSFGG
ncbi:MAG: hypothetical protein JXA21_05080 [Anaerolineae bacterium]|nr:hypothetical protein [Anaerolineae bacterium]